ncbi:MAG: HAMP domain-containing histidine kinase [Chloroflexi bacterium]|nr:HAMP domain-containing histidine kinase [Chloroflexota bacterium]
MGRRLPFTSIIGLWRWPVWLALALATLLGLGWLALLHASGTEFDLPEFTGSLSFGIVATALTFLFLTRLPQGRWGHQLRYELLVALLLLVLSMGLYQLAYWVIPPLVRYDPMGGSTYGRLPRLDQQSSDLGDLNSNPMSIVLMLNGFSLVAVRLAARCYRLMLAYRKRRLVWYITSSQLMLVVMAVLLLVILFLTLSNIRLGNSDLSPIGRVVIVLTEGILILGTIGILTGVAILVVIVPVTVLAYFTARGITRRVYTLINVTNAIRAGDYTARALVAGEDEVAQLQANFNAMAATLENTLRDLAAERDAVSQLLQSRREMFASVSHELRTPVATVRAYLASLQRQADQNPDLKTDIDIIERATLHLQRMIDDVFLLARTDMEGLNVTVAPLEISGVLERTYHTAKQQAWQSKKVEVALEYQVQIPLIYADETRLEQILNNLLKNAVRHTSPGGVIVVGTQVEAQTVAIQVKDTGEGIAPEDLPHIWERFYRSASARASDQGGAGLGLALVKELAEAMAGNVSVTSTLGIGSCFTVRLPRVNPQ